METQIPNISVKISIDWNKLADPEPLRIKIQDFIQQYNDTWETEFSYADLCKDSSETALILRLIDDMEHALQDLVNDTLADEFLNGLNFELNRLKTIKEMNL